MGDMRRATLVIGCGDSALRARMASDRSDGGGSNLSRVAIDHMADYEDMNPILAYHFYLPANNKS